MATFTYLVRTFDPEWVPYAWTVEVDAATPDEARMLAASLDGRIVNVEQDPGAGADDLTGFDRVVRSVEQL